MNELTRSVTSAAPGLQNVVGQPVATIGRAAASAPAPALPQRIGPLAATSLPSLPAPLPQPVAPFSTLIELEVPALAESRAPLLGSTLASILPTASRAITASQGAAPPLTSAFSGAQGGSTTSRPELVSSASRTRERSQLSTPSARNLVEAGVIETGVSQSTSLPSTRTVPPTGTTLRPNVLETLASDTHGAGTLPTLASSLATDRRIERHQVLGPTFDTRGWPILGSTPVEAWPGLEALPPLGARATTTQTLGSNVPRVARAAGVHLPPTALWSLAELTSPGPMLAGHASVGAPPPTRSPRSPPNDPEPMPPLPPLGSLGAAGASSSGGGGGFNPAGSGAAAAVLATLISLFLAGWRALVTLARRLPPGIVLPNLTPPR
ncbi:MAG: hypothetical protein M3069_28980 [Chloroflexota bacterium]|nr:hypothetical protein [Chloroflexota bacterium]